MSELRNLAAAALTALTLFAGTPTADIAHGKFALIESLNLREGARVYLSSVEMSAWAADEAKLYAPGAVRNTKLVLGTGIATGSLMVDFLKLRQAATGEKPGWLMQTLFAGERPVTVTAHFTSRNHRARVDVDRVEVSGVPIEGATLNFLIENWLRPTFPDVKIDEWFDLAYRMDRFTLTPTGVSVFIGK